MTEQSDKISKCVKEAFEVRKSLREIAQDDPAQGRALADALIREKDPSGDIVADLISPGKVRDAISQGEIASFERLHDNFFAENAAVVALVACAKKPADRGR